jgi:hypothetical protein
MSDDYISQDDLNELDRKYMKVTDDYEWMYTGSHNGEYVRKFIGILFVLALIALILVEVVTRLLT